MYYALQDRMNTCVKEYLDYLSRNISSKSCGDVLKDRSLKDLITSSTQEALLNETCDSIIPKKLVSRMVSRAASRERKKLTASVVKLEEASKASYPDKIVINVDWHHERRGKSLVPSVTVLADDYVTYGHANSDTPLMESVAIASAMNKNPSAMRALFDHAEVFAFLPYNGLITSFDGLPCVIGSRGMEYLLKSFKFLGFNVSSFEGQRFNYYILTKEK